MAKHIPCPECSKSNVKYLMTVQPEREYDPELEMSVMVYIHHTCKTQLRVIGLMCIDCGGSGTYKKEEIISFGHKASETTVVVTKDCPYCVGWGIIPHKFVIIPGDVPRVVSRQHNNFNSSHDNDYIDVSSLSTGAANNRGYGVGCRRVIAELIEDVGEGISRWLRGE